MKKIFAAAALVALNASLAQAQTPQPADWTILTLTANTNKPAAITWDRIGGHDWCGILRFLNRLTGCTINSGTGEVGSVRTVMVGTTPTVEIAVARTPLSYTYAQPYTPIFYHGTKADLGVGDLLKPGYGSNFAERGLPNPRVSTKGTAHADSAVRAPLV